MEENKSSRGLIIALVLIVAGMFWVASWTSSASGPNETALAALQSDATVNVTVQADLISFEPTGTAHTTALIFYPGGKVDFRAYAPVLHRIAAEGFAVYTPAMPLYLAFLDSDAAAGIIAAHPDIENWVIAGHSLGGVAASGFAAGNPAIDGIVFWASYPQGTELKNTSIPVLSIYGTLDSVVSLNEVEASRGNLPESAQFLSIEGGNHAQFGAYGPQEGDTPATIAAEAQYDLVAAATAGFLADISR